jgi:GIY-YIG catalytic domain
MTRKANNLKAEPLVEAHIKSLAVDVIEKHRACFRGFLGQGRSGIYVLRKNREIYYVGLASSLRSRLDHHLKDHLKGKWDEFDLYIIRPGKVKYIRELEALLIRVAKPSGNRNEPKFVRHKNITQGFRKALVEEVDKLFLS